MTKHLDCVEQFDLLTQQGDKTSTESWLPVVNSTLKTANFVCRDDFLGKKRHLKSPNSHSKHIPTSSGGSCGSGRINRSPSKARVAQSGLPQSTSCGFDFQWTLETNRLGKLVFFCWSLPMLLIYGSWSPGWPTCVMASTLGLWWFCCCSCCWLCPFLSFFLVCGNIVAASLTAASDDGNS